MIQIFDTLARSCPEPKLFELIPTWYRYLKLQDDDITNKCEVSFRLMKNDKFNGTDILLVGLGIIDILIRIAALVAVAFVLYGGIKYITSQGSPENTKSAQNTILNALIGLAITIIAATLVAFIGRSVN